MRFTYGNTNSLNAHLISVHPKEKETHSEKDHLVKTLRAEKSVRIAKNKSKGDLFKQIPLGQKGNVLSLDFQVMDKQCQERWDSAVMEFMSKTNCSFKTAENLDVLVNALFPSRKKV